MRLNSVINRLLSDTTFVRSFFSIVSKPPTPIFKNAPRAINIQIDRSLIDRVNSCIPKSDPNAHSKIPDSQEIKQGQEGLVEIFRKDKGVKKDFCELFQSSRRGNAFGIDYQVPKESDNPHGRCLIATTILSGFGLIPVLNKSNNALFGEVVSGVGKVEGHQDAIFYSDGDFALVKHLAIINRGGSMSDCKTWYKSNELILEQLERDFPSSYYILKTINFTSKDSNKTQPIIGKDNQLNFINHFSCLPIQRDLDEHCVSKEKLLEAKLNLDKVINSKEGREHFLLKDRGVEVSQLVCADNRLGFHGREPGSGIRSLSALALEKDKISVTSSSISGR